jgi:hypothetical protein
MPTRFVGTPPHVRPYGPTTKIRTIRGPQSADSPASQAFTLVRGAQGLYHQQTKNLLGILHT